MNCTTSTLAYRQTGYFSTVVTDYINNQEAIKDFYRQPVSIDGITATIKQRKNYNTDRTLLSSVLHKQYNSIETTQLVKHNIDSLLSPDTFTICTAHQPNIFTGPLYFIYKILHTVKVARWLKTQIPGFHFVPVYYMGSEDADLEELGHVYINGNKHEWKTWQKGAVGRMKVDKALVEILNQISGNVSVYPFGKEMLDIVKKFYTEGQSIEHATFRLVNELFSEYGLLILLPDNPEFKRSFVTVIERELLDSFSHKEVQEVVSQFPPAYKVQASGREINMFYLIEDKRERIEHVNGKWKILNTGLSFSKQELIAELHEHPERFSPNVILRPVFQEWLLPNIGFIGGGGEISYWLQLKKVFEKMGVPYPVLVVRNSFLIIDKTNSDSIRKLRLGITDIFKSELDLMNELVKRDSKVQVTLENEKATLNSLYDQIKNIAGKVDPTLLIHVQALQTQALKRVVLLEKKILKAGKKKFEAEQRQLQKIKAYLFPNNNLQERVENIMSLYAKWGKNFLDVIYENSLTLEQEFTIISEIE